MNESTMQAILMDYCMEEKKHRLVLPNVTLLYRWEADLLSATKSWLVHEFEIKLTASDYAADMKKRRKHAELLRVFNSGHDSPTVPNYFWYVIHGFETPQPPPYAGLLRMKKFNNPHFKGWYPVVEHEAPRLHGRKLSEGVRIDATRWLSYKLKNIYYTTHVRNGERSLSVEEEM